MSTLQTAADTYRMQQIASATPLDLLIMAYDAALIGCNNQDLERTTRALNELKKALDFNYDADIAMGFHRLYTYCADQAREGNYEHVAEIIRDLRNTWQQVKEQYQPAPAVPAGNPYAAGAGASHAAPMGASLLGGALA